MGPQAGTTSLGQYKAQPFKPYAAAHVNTYVMPFGSVELVPLSMPLFKFWKSSAA